MVLGKGLVSLGGHGSDTGHPVLADILRPPHPDSWPWEQAPSLAGEQIRPVGCIDPRSHAVCGGVGPSPWVPAVQILYV
jgi:hypothetical protein